MCATCDASKSTGPAKAGFGFCPQRLQKSQSIEGLSWFHLASQICHFEEVDLSRCFSLHLLASGSDGSPPRCPPKRRRQDLALHSKRNASERIVRLLFTWRASNRMFSASHWSSRTLERVLNLEKYRSAGSMHFLRVGANSIASERDPAFGQYKAQGTHN